MLFISLMKYSFPGVYDFFVLELSRLDSSQGKCLVPLFIKFNKFSSPKSYKINMFY